MCGLSAITIPAPGGEGARACKPLHPYARLPFEETLQRRTTMSADCRHFQKDVRCRAVTLDADDSVDHPMSVGHEQLRGIERRLAIHHPLIRESLQERDEILQLLRCQVQFSDLEVD